MVTIDQTCSRHAATLRSCAVYAKRSCWMPEATVRNVEPNDGPQPKAKLLLVDDDELIRDSLTLVLKFGGFEVVTASNVNEALKVIGSQIFDVLLSDLHMPGAGDGLTVVSAMRHSNPKACNHHIQWVSRDERSSGCDTASSRRNSCEANGPGDAHGDHPGAPETWNSYSRPCDGQRGDDPRTKHAVHHQ
jgi:CheY-like chemotaxis protein